MCSKIPSVLVMIFSLAMLAILAGSNVACGYYSKLWLEEATASVRSKAADSS